MAGSFSVSVERAFAVSTVTVKVTSINNYHGTVTMTYTADPSSGTATPSPTTNSLYVPKQGVVTDSVDVTLTGSCIFYASGTDGTLASEADIVLSI